MKSGIFFLVAGICAVMAAHASHSCASNDCTENAKVDYVQTGRDGGFMVCFDKPVNTAVLYPGNAIFKCNSGPSCVTMDAADPGAKSMLSLILSANATGAKVDFYVRDNQCIYPTTNAGWYQLTSATIER